MTTTAWIVPTIRLKKHTLQAEDIIESIWCHCVKCMYPERRPLGPVSSGYPLPAEVLWLSRFHSILVKRLNHKLLQRNRSMLPVRIAVFVLRYLLFTSSFALSYVYKDHKDVLTCKSRGLTCSRWFLSSVGMIERFWGVLLQPARLPLCGARLWLCPCVYPWM